jgi:phospholipid/cholesterol/gamma-HCH transport system ATP-binding protein
MHAVAVFTIEDKDLEAIDKHLGFNAAELIIRSLGSFIAKHFGAVGGFSSRQTRGEYATVLPNSNLEEAERIMENFTKDFQENGIQDIDMQRSDEINVEFSVLGGLAQGNPQIESETVMEFAKFNQKEISRFKC